MKERGGTPKPEAPKDAEQRPDEGFFTVTRLHRDDIKDLYERQGRLTRAAARRVEALTDEDMQRIAADTAEGMQESFWDALDAALEGHRAGRARQAARKPLQPVSGPRKGERYPAARRAAPRGAQAP